MQGRATASATRASALVSVCVAVSACWMLISSTGVACDAGHGPGKDAPGWPLAKILPSLSIENITGVWVGHGDQFSSHVWSAYFKENTLPACDPAAEPTYTYKHWNALFPDSLAIMYNATTKQGTIINGHDNGTYVYEHASYVHYKLAFTYEGEVSCATFVPYIDLRNGMVYAQSIYKSEWTRGKDGKVTSKDITCHMKQIEVAGCYPQSADVVHSVSVATHQCKAGNCLNFAPAFLEVEH